MSHNVKRVLFAILGCALLLAATTTQPAQAESIFIDFGRGGAGYDDGLSPDNSGRYWNNATRVDDVTPSTGVVVSDAVDEDGDATTVDLNVLDGFQSNGINATGILSSSITDWDSPVTRDSWFATTATPEIRFEGLIVGGIYDLTFYGSRNTSDNRTMDVAIGATTQSYNAGGGVATGEGMTTFTGITADASGYILAEFAKGTGSTAGYLGGIEIALVPEPSVFVLLGMAGLGLMWMRRRRK